MYHRDCDESIVIQVSKRSNALSDIKFNTRNKSINYNIWEGNARKLTKLVLSGFEEWSEKFANMDSVFSFQRGPILFLL